MPRTINLESSDGASEVGTREVGSNCRGDGEVEHAGFRVGGMTSVEPSERALCESEISEARGRPRGGRRTQGAVTSSKMILFCSVSFSLRKTCSSARTPTSSTTVSQALRAVSSARAKLALVHCERKSRTLTTEGVCFQRLDSSHLLGRHPPHARASLRGEQLDDMLDRRKVAGDDLDSPQLERIERLLVSSEHRSELLLVLSALRFGRRRLDVRCRESGEGVLPDNKGGVDVLQRASRGVVVRKKRGRERGSSIGCGGGGGGVGGCWWRWCGGMTVEVVVKDPGLGFDEAQAGRLSVARFPRD